MPDNSKLNVPDQVAGYKKVGLEPLGVGGMGVVWLYKEIGLPGREVAIKFINTAKMKLNKANLMREIQVLSALPPHQNVIAMHTVIEEPLALVMEYVPGRTNLRGLIKKHPNGIPIGLMAEILRGMLEGVAHAHAHRVFHRDIKPENVLVRLAEPNQQITNRCIKIVDFGISKVYMDGDAPPKENKDENETPLTMMGAYTEAYAAPEQINGDATGAYTDIYQIGTILYEMLSGTKPFTGKTSDVIAGHCYSPPPPLEREDVPGPLRAMMITAMSKNSKERFQDAEEMLRALNDLGDLNNLADSYDGEGTYTEESVTIRAGIKQKHRMGQQGQPDPFLTESSYQAAERPYRQEKRPVRAKKSNRKYGFLAIVGLAAAALVLFLANPNLFRKKSPKIRSGPTSVSSYGTYSDAQTKSSNYSGYYSSPSLPTASTQSSSAPKASYPSSAPSSAPAPPKPSGQPQTDRPASGAADPKTTGLGEQIGRLLGAGANKASQIKGEDLDSAVNKGFGFLNAVAGKDQVISSPSKPSWPPDAPAGSKLVVLVQVDVGPDGVPSNPKVLSSPPSAFHAPARDYAMNVRFKARNDSKTNPYIVSVTFEP